MTYYSFGDDTAGYSFSDILTKEDLTKAFESLDNPEIIHGISVIKCENVPKDMIVLVSQKVLRNVAEGRPIFFGCEEPEKEWAALVNINPKEVTD